MVSGLALLFLSDEAFTFLSESSGVASPETITVKIASSSQDSLGETMLSNQKFLALKNNVSKYEFDSICKNPVGQTQVVSTSSTGVVSTSTIIISCSVGNNFPFPVPAPTKSPIKK